MSSAHNTAAAVSPHLVPFRRGPDPRRNPGGISPAEREFKAALEAKHIPKASALLEEVYNQGMAGDAKMAELFFKVCGLIKKPTDGAAIQQQARALLDEMMAEARERRAGASTALTVRPEGGDGG